MSSPKVVPINQSDRAVPYSVEDEKAVLAACIARPERSLPLIASVLQPGDFYIEKYGWVYDAMLALAKQRQQVNVLSVRRALAASGRFEQVGGMDLLNELSAQGGLKVDHVGDYAAAVEKAATQRRLINAGGQIAVTGYDLSLSTEEAEARAQQLLLDVMRRHSLTQITDSHKATRLWLDRLEGLLDRPAGTMPGLSTGFPLIDRMIGGLQNKRLYLVAARPSVGKSALVGNIARSIVEQGKRTLIFSLEMSTEDYVNRWIADVASVDAHRLELGELADEELSRALAANGQIDTWPFHIDESGGLSIIELSNRARAFAMQQDLAFIAVDHIQLMHSGRRLENKNDDLGAVTYGLKMLAKELNVPVLALSQLNRAVETRADHRPTLADLRESGNLEQDADIVAFLYRESLYGETPDNKHTAELIIKKNRGGSLGMAPLYWQGQYTRFSELELTHGDRWAA